MTSIRFHPAPRSATEILGGMIGACGVALALLAPRPAGARYLPDTIIAPNGDIDISIRGDAAIVPEAVYTSVNGDAFITAARRDSVLAICAYNTGAGLQAAFGGNGCYRETPMPGDTAYQPRDAGLAQGRRRGRRGRGVAPGTGPGDRRAGQPV